MTMPNEQPNTPSADVQTSDVAATAASSDEQRAEQSSEKGPSWWDRIMRRPSGAQETADASGDQAQAGGASSPVTLTQEQLDRKIQAETDRREAKRAKEAKDADRRRLRDEDPWAYAEQERLAEKTGEANGALEKFFESIGTEHDRVSIDPVMHAIPDTERKRIMALEGAGRGLDGRKLVVGEALKVLEKHWRAEGEKAAEARLRRNPAFRKQVLSESRGGTRMEPELLPAVGASSTGSSVSALLRERYGIGSG